MPRQSRVSDSGHRRLALCAGLILALIAACGPPQRTRTAKKRKIKPVRTVAHIESGLQTLLGYADLDGKVLGPKPETRVTAVVVFASWCRHCREQMDYLHQLTRAYERLRVIGVSYYESPENGEQAVREYVEHNAPWLRVVRADEPLFHALGRPSHVPSLFLFDGAGKLLRTYLPPKRLPPKMDELRSQIEPLMSDA